MLKLKGLWKLMVVDQFDQDIEPIQNEKVNAIWEQIKKIS